MPDLTGGPGQAVDEPPVERDAGQDLDLDAALEVVAFDDIEAVEFGPAGGDVGQVPAAWRCRPTDSPLTVEDAMPFEDPGDGPDRRDLAGDTGIVAQGALDGQRAVLAEDMLLAQEGPQSDHLVLDGRRGVPRPMGGRRPIGPVDLVEPCRPGPFDPALDRQQARPEAAGRGPHRGAAADLLDQPTTGRLSLTLANSFSPPPSPRPVSDERTDLEALARRDLDVLASDQ